MPARPFHTPRCFRRASASVRGRSDGRLRVLGASGAGAGGGGNPPKQVGTGWGGGGPGGGGQLLLAVVVGASSALEEGRSSSAFAPAAAAGGSNWNVVSGSCSSSSGEAEPGGTGVGWEGRSNLSGHGVEAAAQQRVSVRAAFAGKTVLMTGATGFVGSMVLEQLLRCCPEVEHIFVMIRPKRNSSAACRLQRLLDKPVFQQVLQSQPQIRSRISPVEGDVQAPSACGMRCSELQVLQQRGGVDVVIHSAASISFTDDIRSSLSNNYTATHNVLELARQHLGCVSMFVHVSTAYVNGHMPSGAAVQERLYPHPRLQHKALASRLKAGTADDAERLAAKILEETRMPNVYCLTKHMAEQLVLSYHRSWPAPDVPQLQGSFPVAIVRPAIVGSVEGRPLPGYSGNRAGSTGAALALSTGLAVFTAHHPQHVIDLIPADRVSSCILATAAASLQGLPPPPTAGESVPGLQPQPWVVHAASSAAEHGLTNEHFYDSIVQYFLEDPPPLRLGMGSYPDYGGKAYVGSKWLLQLRNLAGSCRIAALQAALQLAGRPHEARALATGWRAWRTYNCHALDFNLRFRVDNAQALQRMLCANEQTDFPLLWLPTTHAEWSHYLEVYMAGVKSLWLKKAVKSDIVERLQLHPAIACPPLPAALSSASSNPEHS